MKNTKKPKLDTAELIKQRDELIEKHPELKPLQKELEEKLAQTGMDPNKRAKAMFEEMMEQYGRELYPAFDEMQSITNVINEIKKKKKTDED